MTPDEPVPVSLTAARERVIDSLSKYFANDAITLDELERRIERAYAAKTAADLARLTADLDAGQPVVAASPTQPPRPAAGAGAAVSLAAPPVHDRLVVIMSETKRRGMWSVPAHLEVLAVMASTRLDLTQSVLPPVVELELHGVMSSTVIVVPPGVRVVNHVSAFMANVRSEHDEGGYVPPTAPVLRLTGYAFMAEVRVKVRRS